MCTALGDQDKFHHFDIVSYRIIYSIVSNCVLPYRVLLYLIIAYCIVCRMVSYHVVSVRIVSYSIAL